MAIFNTVYGGEKHWEPNANTLLYLPLESDIVDQSGQATTRVFSSSGISYTTVGGVPSIHSGSSSGIILTTPYPIVNTSTNEQTISVLVYIDGTSSSYYRIMEFAVQNNIGFNLTYNNSTFRYGLMASSDYASTFEPVKINQWVHLVVTGVYSGGTTTIKFYVNGVPATTASMTASTNCWGKWPASYEQNQSIFCARDGIGNSAFRGNARELILEEKERTSDEVSKYYNYIKGKLGL